MKTNLSIVAPLYNEEENVARLVARVAEVMRPYCKQRKLTWELVAVDDGSRDTTAAKMAELAGKYPEFKPVYFRRNFGQTAAMQAGFDVAEGDIIITIDGDLQNDPADIPNLLAKMDETGADIVSGWRKNRKDNAVLTNFPSRMANKLLPKITGVTLHDSGCSLKAYKAEVLKNVRLYGEMHRFIPALAAMEGATIEEVVVNHAKREFGQSKYGIDKSIRVVLDMVQLYFFRRFARRPIHFFGYVGMVSFLLGTLGGLYLTALKLSGDDIGGRPLLLLSVMLVILGVQLLGMGILGEMLVRVYHEPQGRKIYQTRSGPAVRKGKVK
ncbi:MAG: glycosyltransferase family 2 protein [Alphaproteobacteria bacterium]